MTITATLAYQGRNHLRYLISSDNPADVLEIPAAGGATPDFLTDSLAGAIKNIAKVATLGYGKIAAGLITNDANVRALLLSDNAATLVGLRPTTLTARLTMRSVALGVPCLALTATRYTLGQTIPAYVISATAGLAGANTAYLDIECPGAIGV